MNTDMNNKIIEGTNLPVELNKVPEKPKHIHLMGICGTAMAGLAGLLKKQGFHVTGSDQNIYPPMSDLLEQLSIPVLLGYHGRNLQPTPQLVIVGNVITRQNPEAIELSRLGIPYLSLPQALRYFAMKDKKSLVISGTHGKTTTSSLLAWILEQAGMDPGFMVGGVPVNLAMSFKLGGGQYFVIEGDEYDTAFFDKEPKFLHYAPWAAVITSIEFDHADIFHDVDHILAKFRKFMALIPSNGVLIANADDPLIKREIHSFSSPLITYGLSDEADWQARDIRIEQGVTKFKLYNKGLLFSQFSTPLYGRYNILNMISVVALCDRLGIKSNQIATALRTFKGVKRRQEIKGDVNGVLIVEDFAHHPTSVKVTVQAVKERYPDKRLIAVFEPRSNSSRRNIFQDLYALSFDHADLIYIPEPPLMDRIPPAERFSSAKLVKDLIKKGKEAFYASGTDSLLKELLTISRPGDIFLIMSNGAFDHLPVRLLKQLENQTK
jgi:UDP-N-acetylmuramate: L-alanyl-gamma-D-glutamyl-meso-diaminopimelate ligase